jgi:hypothetical protein
MGFNTTVVVMNDSLDFIRRDTDFGKKLADAIQSAAVKCPVGISALGASNAATVIETHHADGIALCAIGGNYGSRLTTLWYVGDITSDECKLKILKQFADDLGYRIVRKKVLHESHHTAADTRDSRPLHDCSGGIYCD